MVFEDQSGCSDVKRHGWVGMHDNKWHGPSVAKGKPHGSSFRHVKDRRFEIQIMHDSYLESVQSHCVQSTA